jgi:hypothetical protein
MKFLNIVKFSNITFVLNPSNGSEIIPCVRTDGRKNITNLIQAVRISAKFMHVRYLESTDLGF